MKQEKQKRLKDAGWKVRSAEEFLDFPPEEAEYIDLRIRLGDVLKRLRKEKELTGGQGRAADTSVSLDLLIPPVLALGATRRDLAKVITGG